MPASFDSLVAALGRDGVFSEGHALDAACRALLTIGRMLSPQEAQALLARFERAARKPAAPSLRRRARQRAARSNVSGDSPDDQRRDCPTCAREEAYAEPDADLVEVDSGGHVGFSLWRRSIGRAD
jgi:hypothetical protein